MPSTGDLNQLLTKHAPPPALSATSVLVDVGLAPLVNHLNLIPAYRIYLIAQQLNRSQFDGRGWLTVAELQQSLANFGLDYSPRRFEMLIKEGEGIFWRIRPCERGSTVHKSARGKRLFLAGYIRVWERLGKRLFRIAPDLNLLDAYRPIKYAAFVNVSGSLPSAVQKSAVCGVDHHPDKIGDVPRQSRVHRHTLECLRQHAAPMGKLESGQRHTLLCRICWQ